MLTTSSHYLNSPDTRPADFSSLRHIEKEDWTLLQPLPCFLLSCFPCPVFFTKLTCPSLKSTLYHIIPTQLQSSNCRQLCFFIRCMLNSTQVWMEQVIPVNSSAALITIHFCMLFDAIKIIINPTWKPLLLHSPKEHDLFAFLIFKQATIPTVHLPQK